MYIHVGAEITPVPVNVAHAVAVVAISTSIGRITLIFPVVGIAKFVKIENVYVVLSFTTAEVLELIDAVNEFISVLSVCVPDWTVKPFRTILIVKGAVACVDEGALYCPT